MRTDESVMGNLIDAMWGRDTQMNESESMRFEDTLVLDAQAAKTVVERYYWLCDGDNTPSRFVLTPTDPLTDYWEALPGEPKPNQPSLAQRVAELPIGQYPLSIVDAGRIPVWRRKCLLEDIRHERLESRRSYASPLYGSTRTATSLIDTVLAAFLGIPDVLDGAPVVRFVDDLYPYDFALTDETLGIQGAYRLYPDVMKKTECFVDSNWTHVRKLLSRIWKTRLEGLYIERAMGALDSDDSQWVDALDPDEAVAGSVRVMALAHELLVAGLSIGCDESLTDEEAAVRLTACCNSAGEGLVALGLTPSFFDPNTGAWRR